MRPRYPAPFSVVTRLVPPGASPHDQEVSRVEVVSEPGAGLDVGKDEVVACVRVPDGVGGRRQEVRTPKTFSAELEALADWLTEPGSPRW
jgi:hypothetical protein